MKKSLLVLDDEPAVGATVARIAKRLGFDCTVIQEADRLEGAIIQESPSVLILDLVMPNATGIDVIESLASMQDPPALVLLSGVDKRVLAAATRTAANLGLTTLGSLTKPFGMEEFSQVLDALPPAGNVGKAAVSLPVEPTHGELQFDPVKLIENAEICFQPLVEAGTSKVIGFEALGRFSTSEGEPVRTEDAINLLKQREYLNHYTKILIDRALEFGVKSAFAKGCTIAINVCASQFSTPWLASHLRRRCSKGGVNPNFIVLELTETEGVLDDGTVLRNLTALRVDGFRLAVDDFGQGHSTFSRIADLPFTDLKIDRSFVLKMLDSDDALAIIMASLELAKKFDLKVTAEGVDNERTARKLTSLGCENLQGYFFSSPLGFADAVNWLNQQKSVSGPSGEEMIASYGSPGDERGVESVTICLVDDDSAIRQNMLAGLARYNIDCRPFASGKDFLDGLGDVEADAYLIDLSMPDLDGLQTIKEIPAEHRKTPVIMFSGVGEIAKAVEAMKLGARDFIEKPTTLAAISSKIRSILDEAPDAVVSVSETREAQELLSKLTNREREVIMKVSEGKKNREIAAELGIGTRTIEVHRSRIYSKLGVRNAVELTNLIQRAGIHGAA